MNVMSRKAKAILLIVAYSIIAFLVMYFLIGFDLRKSTIVSGSAGVAMILFDVILARPADAPQA